MSRHLDWERANKRRLPPYDPRPGQEISERSAREDQEDLAKRASLRKKRTKYVRSSPRERRVRELMQVAESVQERRLRAVLASLSHGKCLFELKPSEDLSHRVFERKDVRLRVRIDPQMPRELIAFSPGNPAAFDWLTVSVAPAAIEQADFLAARLRDVIASQSQLRQPRHA